MTGKYKQYINSAPILLLIYGVFAVLCHMAFVFLYAQYLCLFEVHIFEKIFFELFEYTLMSLLLIILGSFLTFIVIKKRES